MNRRFQVIEGKVKEEPPASSPLDFTSVDLAANSAVFELLIELFRMDPMDLGWQTWLEQISLVRGWKCGIWLLSGMVEAGMDGESQESD